MKAQHYSVRVSEFDASRARIGQFVYTDDADDIVRGFVYRVNGNLIELVLFEPTVLSPTTTPVTIFLMPDPDTWCDMLHEVIVTAEENIQWAWCELLDAAQ